MILGIDHILIAVDDLPLATEVYQKLGFQVLQGGTHPKMGTHNALVPLVDGTYLELIGVWDAALAEQFSPSVVAALQSNNRLATFALSSDNLDADIAEIRARGFEIGDPREGERERPDGQRIQWRTAFTTDPRFPFLIQDVTPRELRISEPTFGIGQTLHINDVNVGVIDVPTAQAAYEKLLGISGEDGWFEMQRGAIILKDVNTERVLQIVLEADNPLQVVDAFVGGQVEYTQQFIGGIGITLQPMNTLGAPIQITGRVAKEMELSTLIQSARGNIPADLLLKNGRVVNVFTGEIEETSVAISDSRIVGLGDYDAKKVTDVEGAYICPGFIDAHVHIESALVPPYEFARAVVPHGVTTVVIDPHEIANVLGKQGIRYMLDASKYTPFSVYVMASSCVPATHLETSGATLRWSDLIEFKNDPWVLGLAEVMNYPGVINGELEVLDKLRAFADKRMDGHCPGLTGRDLEAYVASGIASDHECTTVDEANEKLRRGMYVMIREASNAHNLLTLLPIINQRTSRRVLFCTDDRLPDDLIDKGSIDYIVRTAIQHGLDPMTAITIATLNAAEYFGLTDRGAIAPGKRADIVVFNNFEEMKIERVYYGGKRVVYRGKLEPDDHERWHDQRDTIRNTMNVDWSRVDLRVRAEPNANTLRIIGLIPGQLTTREEFDRALIQNDQVVSDTARDILKMAVIERHHATGNVGLGFVRGFKLKSGAIGSSVGHDSHNILVVGTNDDDMLSAARAIASMQGGFVAVDKGQVLGRVPLPIGGLMSEQPIERVRGELDHLNAATRRLGCDLETPFMALSFLALPVIPDLKLTDKGLVDVRKFDFVDVLAD